MNAHVLPLWIALSAGLFALLVVALCAAIRGDLGVAVARLSRGFVASRLANGDSGVPTSLKLFLSGIETASLLLTAEQVAIVAARVADHAALHIDSVLDSLVGTRLRSWVLLPEAARAVLYADVRARIPALSQDVVGAVFERLPDFVSLRDLLYRHFDQNPGLLARLLLAGFDELGGPICIAALCGGAVEGFMQWLLAELIPYQWLLPCTGLVMGLISCALLIQAIFQPRFRYSPAGPQLEGMLIRRHHRIIGRYVSELAGFLCFSDCTSLIVHGPASGTLRQFVKERLVMGSGSTLLGLAATFSAQVDEFLDELSGAVIDLTVEAVNAPQFAAHNRSLLDRTLSTALAMVPAEQLVQLSRGLFLPLQRPLLALGAAIGFLLGLMEWWLSVH